MGCVGEWYHTGISILRHCPLAAITLKYHWPSDTAQENLHQNQVFFSSWSSSTPIAIINWISTQSVYVKWTPRGELYISVNALTVVALKWSPEWQVISVQSFMSTQISKVWCQKDKIEGRFQKPQSRNRSAKGVSPPHPLSGRKISLVDRRVTHTSWQNTRQWKAQNIGQGQKSLHKTWLYLETIYYYKSWKQELKTKLKTKI